MNAHLSHWRDKPPLGTQINWEHPHAQGLCYALLMNEGCGVGGNWYFNDSVQGDGCKSTRNASDTKWVGGDRSEVMNIGATSGAGWVYPLRNLSQLGGGLTQSSISVVGRYLKNGSNPNLEATPGNNGSSLYSTRRASGDVAGFCLYTTAAAFRFVADGSGLLLGATYAVAPSANTFYTVGGSYKRNTSISTYGGTWTVYVNGSTVATNNYSIGGSFTGTFTNNIPTPLTYNSGNDKTSDKQVEFLYVFNRDIGAAGHAALNENPWQIWMPRSVSRWYIPAGTKTSGLIPRPQNMLLAFP